MQVPRSEASNQNHENGYDGHSNGYNGHSDNNYNKPLQMIGMAKKAGLLAVGSDAVQTAIGAGKAELVVFSSDTSEGSVRRARYAADKSGIISISVPYTKFEFSRIAGRGSPGTLAVLDLGLAEGLLKRLSALDMMRYGEIARLLESRVMTKKADKAGKTGKAGKADRADNRRAKV